MKKIIALLFSIVMILLAFPLSVFASDADITYKDLSKTTIESDFETVFYGEFSVDNYVSNKAKSFELITGFETFVDGCSSFYVYIYNPAQCVIDIGSSKNTINFAFYSKEKDDLSFDNAVENAFAKEKLTFIDSYGGTIENESFSDGLILKFKIDRSLLGVEDKKEILNRHYKIADIELLLDGETNATSFIAGRHFEVMCADGYTYTYVSDLATLDIDAYHTFYRTKTEDVDIYSDIQSVYFPVPNDYEKIYGSLYSMSIEYTLEKYNPILLCEDSYIANSFMLQYIDNSSAPSLDNSSFKWSVVFDKCTWNVGDLLFDGWRQGYNIGALEPYMSTLPAFRDMNGGVYSMYSFDGIIELPLWPDCKIKDTSSVDIPLRLAIQYTGDFAPENVAITGEALLDEINSISGDSYFKISKSHYEETITVDDVASSFNKYEICSGWKNFWARGYYNVAGDEVKIEPFKRIDLTELKTLDKQSFSDKYLVDINDIDCGSSCGKCITCCTGDEKYTNCDWYLLRYEQTDFKSWDAVLIDNTTGYYYKDEHKACVVQTDVIRDFDTISLTFKNNTVDGEFFMTFPIGRTPTDFVADATFPSEKPNVELPNDYLNFKEMVDKFMTILKIVIIAFVLIVAFRIVSLVSPFFKKIVKRTKGNNNEKNNN